MSVSKTLIAASALVCLLSGCTYKGAKIVEGTDLAVGFDVPGTEGNAQVNLLNYLSGFRIGIAKNADAHIQYTVKEQNSYFGIISTDTEKTINAKIEPQKQQQ